MKIIIIRVLFFSFSIITFSQNDTIPSFDVKIKYDSIAKQDIYYEKIDKSSNNFFDEKNYKLLDRKIIKDGALLKYIKQGKLTKTIEYKQSLSQKITKLLDENGNVEYIIYCVDNKLKKIEKYKSNKIVFRCKYGLIKYIEEFLYNEKGYVLKEKSNGVETTFLVVIDDITGKTISKTKISSDIKASININDEGYYVVPEDFYSTIYEELKVHCE